MLATQHVSLHWFSKHREGLPFIRSCCQNIGKAATFSLGNSSSHHWKTAQKASRAPTIKNNVSNVLKNLPISNTPTPHTQPLPQILHFEFTAVAQFESPAAMTSQIFCWNHKPWKCSDGKRRSQIIATLTRSQTVVGGKLQQQLEQELIWNNN